MSGSVAIARALVTEPACVLADEPATSDLENGERVFELRCCRRRGSAVPLWYWLPMTLWGLPPAAIVSLTLVKGSCSRCRRGRPAPSRRKELPLPPEQRPALLWLFAGTTLFATMMPPPNGLGALIR